MNLRYLDLEIILNSITQPLYIINSDTYRINKVNTTAKKTGILSDYLYSNSNYLFNNWQLAHYGMMRTKEVLKALNNPDGPNDLDIVIPSYQ